LKSSSLIKFVTEYLSGAVITEEPIPDIQQICELFGVEFRNGTVYLRGSYMHEKEGDGTKHLFNELLAESGLDAKEVLKALEDSIELGFIDWGTHRDYIIKLLEDPAPADLHRLITQSQTILQPLEAWVMLERYLNSLRKGTVSKLEYYGSEYRCSQIQNFILLLKLY
jgi:hypothetical protein